MKTYKDLNKRRDFVSLKDKLSDICFNYTYTITRKLKQLETSCIKTADCTIELKGNDHLFLIDNSGSYQRIDKYNNDLSTETMINFLSVVRQFIDALDKLEDEKCKDLQAALYNARDLVYDEGEQ